MITVSTPITAPTVPESLVDGAAGSSIFYEKKHRKHEGKVASHRRMSVSYNGYVNYYCEPKNIYVSNFKIKG